MYDGMSQSKNFNILSTSLIRRGHRSIFLKQMLKKTMKTREVKVKQ